MSSTRPLFKPFAALALALVAVGPVQAGSIEDGFRAFIDKLRAGGQASTLAAGSPKGASEISKRSLARRTDGLPLGKDQHVLFVADGCKSCPALVTKLEKRSRGQLEVMNITSSATAREAFVLSKAKGVPAMLVGGHVISGYSDKLFERALIDSINDKAVQSRGEGS